MRLNQRHPRMNLKPLKSLSRVLRAQVPAAAQGGTEHYDVAVNGKTYQVSVSAAGELEAVQPAPQSSSDDNAPTGEGTTVAAPLAGNIFKVNVSEGDEVSAGDVLIVMEAMKMETDIKAEQGGTVSSVHVKEGDAVSVDDELVTLG